VSELNSSKDAPVHNSIAYEVTQLLQILQTRKAADADLVRLEWTFLPLLSMGFSAKETLIKLSAFHNRSS